MYRNGLIFRIMGAILLLVVAVAGGYMAYKAGVAQGVSQAPAVATAIAKAAENGNPSAMAYQYGFGYPHPHGFGYAHFGLFPFGFCGSILFIFFLFGLLRLFFFRPWHHREYVHGPWGRHWEGGVPPMFDEWHKRSHGEAPAKEGGKSSDEDDS